MGFQNIEESTLLILPQSHLVMQGHIMKPGASAWGGVRRGAWRPPPRGGWAGGALWGVISTKVPFQENLQNLSQVMRFSNG